MKNSIQLFKLIFFLLIGFTSIAQQKKWTIQECVEYALKNNISIKQSELDVRMSDVDKKAAIGNFFQI